MDALAHKVKAVGSALVIKKLEFMNKLNQCLMSFFEVLCLDLTLIDNADGEDEFAEVHVIWLWEDKIKYTRSKPIEIDQKFPSLVAA
jgi:hypothetical protein